MMTETREPAARSPPGMPVRPASRARPATRVILARIARRPGARESGPRPRSSLAPLQAGPSRKSAREPRATRKQGEWCSGATAVRGRAAPERECSRPLATSLPKTARGHACQSTGREAFPPARPARSGRGAEALFQPGRAVAPCTVTRAGVARGRVHPPRPDRSRQSPGDQASLRTAASSHAFAARTTQCLERWRGSTSARDTRRNHQQVPAQLLPRGPPTGRRAVARRRLRPAAPGSLSAPVWGHALSGRGLHAMWPVFLIRTPAEGLFSFRCPRPVDRPLEPLRCRDSGGAEEGAHTPFGLGGAAEKDVRPGCGWRTPLETRPFSASGPRPGPCQ
ncbi:hypothetical protein COEX109129_06280 [Corallococcus exiguus]